jgi:hypothetical protein
LSMETRVFTRVSWFRYPAIRAPSSVFLLVLSPFWNQAKLQNDAEQCCIPGCQPLSGLRHA